MAKHILVAPLETYLNPWTQNDGHIQSLSYDTFTFLNSGNLLI
jgi:hypothetical protein